MPDLNTIIEQSASEPASFSSDGQSATSRPIGELIALDQHQSAKTTRRRRLRGISITQLQTPGASGIDCGGGSFDRPGGC